MSPAKGKTVKIQIGAGNTRLAGFTNVDIRPLETTDVIGHAGNLSRIPNDSVEVLYSHAVFEHLFVAHHLPVLREWKRVVTAEGWIVMIGLPDFRIIAELYLRGERGIVGPRFDLYNVYRYTHGAPEQTCGKVWDKWAPDEHPDAAPAGWLPQLHKSILDVDYMARLMRLAGLQADLFNYAYPGEPYRLNIGVVARKVAGGAAGNVEGAKKVLALIPGIEGTVRLETINMAAEKWGGELLLEVARPIGGWVSRAQASRHAPEPRSLNVARDGGGLRLRLGLRLGRRGYTACGFVEEFACVFW